MTQPASGWYPDPSGQPGERWWNGSTWSQDTRPAPAAAPPPAPQAYDGFGKPAAPGTTPPPYAGGAPAYGSAPPAYGEAPAAPGGPQAGAPTYGGTPGYGSTPTNGGAPGYGSTPGHGGAPTYGGTPGYGGAPTYGGTPDQPGHPVGSVPPPYAGGPGGYGTPSGGAGAAGGGAFLRRNGYSFATIGVAVAYLLLLFFAHLAVVGILPLVLGISAVRRREPLGILGAVVGVAALVFGIYVYTR